MSSFSKIAVSNNVRIIHPFKVDISKKKSAGNSKPEFTLAVNYHSKLYRGFKSDNQNGAFFSYDLIAIKGLDFPLTVPNDFPSKNIYCILEIDVSNLSPRSPTIKLVPDSNPGGFTPELQPIVLQDSQNLRQTKARIIIATFVADDESFAGLPPNGVNTPYIIQHVNTNLILCNFVINGVSVIYPVPIAGGKLNENFVAGTGGTATSLGVNTSLVENFVDIQKNG
jgi:hypothetical protein